MTAQQCVNCDNWTREEIHRGTCALEWNDMINIFTGKTAKIGTLSFYWCYYWDGDLEVFDLPDYGKELVR